MSWRRALAIIRRTFFLPAQTDRDLDAEIRFHLAEEERLLSDRGLAPDQARVAARRAFGNAVLTKEATRAVWVSTALEQFVQDLRGGCRILTRSPGVSVAAIGLVALVIGGNTTVFTIAHGILTKPAPGVHATGLMTVSWVAENGFIETHTGHRVYEQFLQQSVALQPIAAFDFQRVTVLTPAGSSAVHAGIVSPNYFETLGVRFVHGRPFSTHETERGTSGLAVVISDQLWQTAYQGRPDLERASLVLNGQPMSIVGVAEPAFRGALLPEHADLWVPLSPEPRDWLQRGGDAAMIGRLAPGATRSEAQAELATLWGRLQLADPAASQAVKLNLVPYSATAGGNSLVATRGYQMLAIFSLVTLLTLAIVCANVANLLIARAATRERETALRRSLGASRVRIVRSLLAEGFILSVAAWLAACLFAWWVSKVIPRFLVPPVESSFIPPDLTPDWTVIGYALGLALMCTMAVTVGPALRAWRQPLLPFLKVGEAGSVPGRSRLSRALVVIQLAFSILLLTTAGLAYRSLSLAESLDVGFDTRNIVLATVSTTGVTTGALTDRALLDTLQRAISDLPEVDHVSYVSGGRLSGRLDFPLRREVSADSVMAADSRVAPGFFATLGVPIIAGRDFTRDDRHGRPTVIVTDALADSLFPGKSAIGQFVLVDRDDRAVEVDVIGVVRDAFFSGRGAEARPRHVFLVDAGHLSPTGQTTFYVRHRGDLARLGPAIMRVLRDVEPRVPVASLRSMEAEIAADVAPIWMLTMLLTLFAGSSLLIAAMGHYAVVAFDARRRTREFGLRIALGASAQQLLALVIGDSLRLTALGLLVGFALSVAVGTVLARVLFGITPTDPPTYLSVFAVLAMASLLASYLPARRAARTDPLKALRTE